MKRLDRLNIDDVLGAMGLMRRSHAAVGGAGLFFVGLGAGLFAGGATALLLAPTRGSEIRRRIARVGEALGHSVSSTVSRLGEGIKSEAMDRPNATNAVRPG